MAHESESMADLIHQICGPMMGLSLLLDKAPHLPKEVQHTVYNLQESLRSILKFSEDSGATMRHKGSGYSKDFSSSQSSDQFTYCFPKESQPNCSQAASQASFSPPQRQDLETRRFLSRRLLPTLKAAALAHDLRLLGTESQQPEVDINKLRFQMPRHFETLIWELMVNAKKAHASTVTLRMRILFLQRLFLTIEIHDNGDGLKPSDLELIANTGSDLNSSRSGRGLRFCRSAMVAAGGQFSMDSKLGLGTSVRLFLPAFERGK